MTDVAFAVTTRGDRPAELRRLLASIAAQNSRLTVRVSIADQSSHGLPSDLLNFPLDINVVRGSRGAAAGRNQAMLALPDAPNLWAFPNDTSYYPESFLARLEPLIGNVDILIGSYRCGETDRHSIRTGRDPVNRRNVWLALEASTILSQSFLSRHGLFDESLGTGSDGLRQSGEMSDLLLRSLGTFERTVWAPSVIIHGVTQDFRLTKNQICTKEYGYARGYMAVMNRYKYGLFQRGLSVCKPLLQSFLPWSESDMLRFRYKGRRDELREHLLQQRPDCLH